MNQRYNLPARSPLSATPVSFGIILVCAIAYLTRFQPLALALWPLESGYFTPWQLLSYAFLHGSFNHLFFNMFAVWMFGTPLEQSWGSQRFALYFTVCVVGAAVMQLLVQVFEGGVYPPSARPAAYSACCWRTARCGRTTVFSCCFSRFRSRPSGSC